MSVAVNIKKGKDLASFGKGLGTSSLPPREQALAAVPES
jgi:hypothetical protein